MITKHKLNKTEIEWLKDANVKLTAITAYHSVCCDCELCKARMLTDCQDKEFFAVQCFMDE